MMLKRVAALIFLSVSLMPSCNLSQSQVAGPTQEPNLPAFLDDPVYRVGEDLGAPRQTLIYYRNLDAIEEILKYDSALVRQEMERRLSPREPISLRLIAAAVLVLKNDPLGKQFFVERSTMTESLGEVYITLNQLTYSAKHLIGFDLDLTWAEDLMIEALLNRTKVDRREALRFQRNVSWQDPTIEVRELAVNYGEFSLHLARVGSKKALPVILALLREYPFYRLKGTVAYLSRYNDERAAALVLEFLKRRTEKHKDSYGAAVSAASEMKLKAAIPILLQHLDKEDSYPGLVALGDTSLVPKIRAALPRFRSSTRAAAELALIYLKGGDVVPPLLHLLRQKTFLKRHEVIMKLVELRDPRSVPLIATTLCHDPDWFIRSFSIRVLTGVGNKEAVQALVNGLGCDYSGLERGKTASDHDFNQEYRAEIAKALKELTGENFGVDQQKWSQWLNQRPDR